MHFQLMSRQLWNFYSSEKKTKTGQVLNKEFAFSYTSCSKKQKFVHLKKFRLTYQNYTTEIQKLISMYVHELLIVDNN